LPMSLPSDYAAKIAEALNWKLAAVQETFNFEEDKQGFFWAKLKPKMHLDTPDFRAVCKLTRELGGEDYLQGARSWQIPGAMAKIPSGHGTDSQDKPSEQAMHSPATYKEPGKAMPTITSAPSADKGPKKVESSPLIIKVGYYEHFPLAAILSPIFTLRLHIEENIQELVQQIATTRASGEQAIVLEPLVCRPAAKAGYVEVAAGERRLLASRMLGLGNIPVIIKDMSDEEFDRIRLMENFARKDLSDYEVGRALKYLLDKYPAVYPTQANLADVFGKDGAWVTHHLQMLKPELANILSRDKLESGAITEHQAREILAAPKEKREAIVDKIKETGEVPSVREIHEIAHPEKKQIMCARCGYPVEGTPVHWGGGKFYHADCAEQEVSQSKKGLISEEDVGPFEEHETEEEEPSPPLTPKMEAKAITIGEFDCTECKKHFLVEHLPNGEHRLVFVMEGSS